MNTLGTALRDLAPEPPAGLGRPETARRRARAIRRRRNAAVAATTVLALVTAAGVALRPSRPVEPSYAVSDRYPDWPRRGDAPRSVDRRAVETYERWLPKRHTEARLYGTPRVLYAGGAPLVVVLHAVTTVGGERFVVLTETGGTLGVWSDTYAPKPVAQTVTVLLNGTPLPHFDELSPCGADPLSDPASPVRLLLLAPAGTPTATVHVRPHHDSHCAGDARRERPAMTVALEDGVAVVDPDLGPRAQVVVPHGGETYVVAHPHHLAHAESRNPGPAPLGWVARWDGSRAVDLHETLWRAAELDPLGGSCAPYWFTSLPDGTPLAFCLTGDRYAVLGAEGADRTVRVYLQTRVRQETPDSFAAVVDGFDGRWLVVLGPPALARAELVDGDRRVPVPVHDGYGFVRLDREPAPDARVTTSRGDLPVDATGRELARRR